MPPEWAILAFMGMLFASALAAKNQDENVVNLERRAERFSRADADVDALRLNLEQRADFALYLRDFDSGTAERNILEPGASPGSARRVFGSATTSEIIACFQQRMPLVMLDNVVEKTPIDGALIVCASDESWELVLRILTEHATYVVADFRRLGARAPSSGVEKELQHLSTLTNKVILLAYASDMASIARDYPTLSGATALTCVLPDDTKPRDVGLNLLPLRHFLSKNASP